MSANIEKLYQEVILDHNRNPKNFREIEDATHVQEGHNPLCGDHLHIYLKVDKDSNTITDISFKGEGCAISKASSSMMTQRLKGMDLTTAKKTFSEFHELLKGTLNPEKDNHDLGKLQIFAGIWQYPSRVKCASLAWHSFHSAIQGDNAPVKTE